MTQITDHIWVGACSDSANTSFLQERKIEHILCCAEEYQHPPGFLYMAGKTNQWYQVPIKDNTIDDSTEDQFKDGAAKLHEWVEQGNQVLVHCYQGKSRSVSVIITYLMLYKGWAFDIAYRHLKQRHNKTNPYPLYVPILKAIGSGEKYRHLDS